MVHLHVDGKTVVRHPVHQRTVRYPRSGSGHSSQPSAPARTGKNPKTGAAIKIAATTVPKSSSAGATFKAAVAELRKRSNSIEKKVKSGHRVSPCKTNISGYDSRTATATPAATGRRAYPVAWGKLNFEFDYLVPLCIGSIPLRNRQEFAQTASRIGRWGWLRNRWLFLSHTRKYWFCTVKPDVRVSPSFD